MSVHLNLLGDKNPWWYPKSGGTWITDTISEEDLRVVGIIANLCLAEIIIGTFKEYIYKNWLHCSNTIILLNA